MIKINSILKEAYASYSKNFNDIILMALPIFVLTMVFYFIPVEWVAQTVDALVSIVVGLFFVPALYRALQKYEDDKHFHRKASYDFAWKNIWKFIVVSFWSAVFMFVKMIRYIIVAVLIAILWYVLGRNNDGLAVGLGAAAMAVLMVGAILNIAKFVFVKNIFFSKTHLSARHVVDESIALGESEAKNIWKVILSVFVFAIMYLIAVTLLYFVAGFVVRSMSFITDQAYTYKVFNVFASNIVSIFFVTPMTFIIMAKGYNKIKKLEE